MLIYQFFLHMFQYRVSMILFTVLAILLKGYECQPQMQVIIQNTPNFFYSHKCPITFSIISANFSQYNDESFESFFITITQKYSNYSNFLMPVQPVVAHLTDLSQLKMSNPCRVDPPNATYFPVCVQSNIFVNPQRRSKYNATHYMYKFTILNFACPDTPMGKGEGGAHVKFKIQVPIGLTNWNIKMSGQYTFRFTQLGYRIIQQSIINPIYDSLSSLIPTPSYTPFSLTPSYKKFTSYSLGCQSPFSLSFSIPNATQSQSWQDIQITLTQAQQNQIQVVPSTCKITRYLAIPFTTNWMVSSIEEGKNRVICDVSTTGVQIGVHFSNWAYEGYVYNDDFNMYAMYNQPGTRVEVSFEIVTKKAGVFTASYQITSTGTKFTNINGTVQTSPTPTRHILHSQPPTPLSILTSSQVSSSSLIQKCNTAAQSTLITNINNIFSTSTLNTYIAGNPFAIILLLLVIVAVVVCCRERLYWGDSLLYGLLVMAEYWVKMAVGISIAGELGFWVGLFAVSGVVAGLIIFCTYFVYLYFIIYPHIESKHKPTAKQSLIYLALTFYNYKFLILPLLPRIPNSIPFASILPTLPSMSRNPHALLPHLIYKHCIHVAIDGMTILAQIFIMVGGYGRENRIAVWVYCGYLVIMVVVGTVVVKGVYRASTKGNENKNKSIARMKSNVRQKGKQQNIQNQIDLKITVPVSSKHQQNGPSNIMSKKLDEQQKYNQKYFIQMDKQMIEAIQKDKAIIRPEIRFSKKISENGSKGLTDRAMLEVIQT